MAFGTEKKIDSFTSIWRDKKIFIDTYDKGAEIFHKVTMPDGLEVRLYQYPESAMRPGEWYGQPYTKAEIIRELIDIIQNHYT